MKEFVKLQNTISSGGGLLADRGQEVRKAGVYSNVIAHLLSNLEFVIKRSRNKCAMTVLNIQSLVFLGEGVIRCQEARKTRGQASLEDRKVRRYEGKLFGSRRTGCQDVKLLSVLRTKITSVISLPSCPPNFCSSDCTPP